MSLADVKVTLSEFDEIHSHLTSDPRGYRNMHMRQMRTRNKKPVLRYLHAMYATPVEREVEGMISGPGVFWHYKIIRSGHGTRMRVFDERGTPKDFDRIEVQFLKEVMRRVDQEKAGPTPPPKLSPDQFYLRRRQTGMRHDHPNCVGAVSAGVLDNLFVSKFEPWQFALLCT